MFGPWRIFPCLRPSHRSVHPVSLWGHYQHFIKGFTNIAQPLYDVLGREVKMGPV